MGVALTTFSVLQGRHWPTWGYFLEPLAQAQEDMQKLAFADLREFVNPFAQRSAFGPQVCVLEPSANELRRSEVHDTFVNWCKVFLEIRYNTSSACF